jgi:hypothetical protein
MIGSVEFGEEVDAMKTYRGTVRGKVVVLSEEVDLHDGQEVEVRAVAADERPAGMAQLDNVDPEEAFLQHLLEIGLISEIKRRSPVEPPDRISPAKLPGKPLSEIVLEERR